MGLNVHRDRSERKKDAELRGLSLDLERREIILCS